MNQKSQKGFIPVASAFVGNVLITCIKFFAAAVSGSSSMFAEAIHSLADAANQMLLLVGLRRSLKKADDLFEYGYGNELSFWALISACGIFFAGAGITAYQGIHSLLNPYAIEFSPVVFVVLFLSLILESYTFYVAATHLRAAHPYASWLRRLSNSDPSTLAVFLEDGVAVIGIFIATICIGLSYYTGNSTWDASGSLVIATLLGVTAVILIIKNHSYLLGHSMPDELQEKVLELMRSEPAIEKIIDFKSSVIGVGVYRIKCEIEFNGPALFQEEHQQSALHNDYEKVQGDFEAFKRFCAEYMDRIPRMIGSKIDEIEARIKKIYPDIRHIDIELN